MKQAKVLTDVERKLLLLKHRLKRLPPKTLPPKTPRRKNKL